MNGLLVLAASALMVGLCAASSLGRQPGVGEGAERRPPVIAVSGQATLDVAPDQVEMDIAVVTEGQTAQVVIQENNRKAARVMEALRRKGLGEKDLSTGWFSVNPVYSQPKPGERDFVQQIVGYRVSNSIRVKTRRLDLAGDIISTAVESGANNVGQVRFTLSDPITHRRAAIAEAVRNARADAEAAAGAAGVTLSGIRRMDVGGHGGGPVPMMMMQSDAMMSRAESVPLTPGDVTVSAGVTIEYLIEQR